MVLTEINPIHVSSLPIYDLKAHLRLGIGFCDDDFRGPILETYLRAAISAIEGTLGQALLRRSFRWEITAWHDSARQGLPLSPVNKIETIRLIDAQDNAHVVPDRDYKLRHDGYGPAVVPVATFLPNIPDHGVAELTFQAGYGPDWVDLPADLGQAVLLLAAHYYENQSAADTQAWPMAVMGLIKGYRPMRIGGRADAL